MNAPETEINIVFRDIGSRCGTDTIYLISDLLRSLWV